MFRLTASYSALPYSLSCCCALVSTAFYLPFLYPRKFNVGLCVLLSSNNLQPHWLRCLLPRRTGGWIPCFHHLRHASLPHAPSPPSLSLPLPLPIIFSSTIPLPFNGVLRAFRYFVCVHDDFVLYTLFARAFVWRAAFRSTGRRRKCFCGSRCACTPSNASRTRVRCAAVTRGARFVAFSTARCAAALPSWRNTRGVHATPFALPLRILHTHICFPYYTHLTGAARFSH